MTNMRRWIDDVAAPRQMINETFYEYDPMVTRAAVMQREYDDAEHDRDSFIETFTNAMRALGIKPDESPAMQQLMRKARQRALHEIAQCLHETHHDGWELVHEYIDDGRFTLLGFTPQDQDAMRRSADAVYKQEMSKYDSGPDGELVESPAVGDRMLLEWNDSHVVDTEIVDIQEDRITLLADDTVMRFVDLMNETAKAGDVREVILNPDDQPDPKDVAVGKFGQDLKKALKAKLPTSGNASDPKMPHVDDFSPDMFKMTNESLHDLLWSAGIQPARFLAEAEYHGRKVPLGKPMRGDRKKFKVYVRDPKTGNVKKVNFGDPNMRIKRSNPKRRKSFRARHHCSNPGPRTSARYWSCRKW
jgi:hypothetical protein